MDNNYEKSRVNSLLPEFLKETSTGIVKFLKEYYENEYDSEFFKTRTENEEYVDVASSLISGIAKNRDLDRVSEATFIEELSQTVAKNIPTSSVVTRKFLIKRLVDYYDARGNIQMIDAFFRLFFNKDVSLFEPWTQVLIPSSGGYNENLFIRTFNDTVNDAKGSVTKRISQKTVGGSIIAEALVSSVNIESYDETLTVFNLQKNTLIGNFISGVNIQYEDDNGAVVLLGKPYRTLKSINVVNGGSNYSVGDLIFIPEFKSSTFYARVDSVDDTGKITKLRIIEYGSGNTADTNVSPALRDFMHASSTDMMHYYETCLGTNGVGTITDSPPAPGLRVTLNFDLLINEGGRYSDEKGRLSDDIVLQDSYFFQKFSYELSTDQEFSKYKSFYVELLHPAGEKPFHNTEKTLPTQNLTVTNEPFVPRLFGSVKITATEPVTPSTPVGGDGGTTTTPVDNTGSDQRINIPGVVFITKQNYFNVNIGLDSPPAVDKAYIKEDYLTTTTKITY